MKPLYTPEEFTSTLMNDKLPLECYSCGNEFLTLKRVLIDPRTPSKYCSYKCGNEEKKLAIYLDCTNCGNKFHKLPSQIKKSKTGNHFCNKSCSGSYNNKNKTHGNRRSKLEAWLETQLTQLYPNLEIHFNKKDAIGSELDIYIPTLNVAFELNGIFHYEPIFGTEKMNQIRENDYSKTKACLDTKIDLCIIDTSQQKYFKPKTSQKYLKIITNIIIERL